MLFRPSFCANCGEKIERVGWGILTSRRFCQVCESEYKGQDLIPRVIVGIGVLVGIFGFGSYLKSGSRVTDAPGQRQGRKLVEPSAPAAQPVVPNAGIQPDANSVARSAGPQAATPVNKTVTGSAISPPAKRRVETAEQTYYCGAETKKGTPCSRRVRGNVRCFQHVGMPAMASAKN